MDDLRFRSQTSPRNESPMNSLVSHPRNASRLPAPQVAPQHSNDHRSNLPRRFTTDSGRIPTLTTLSNTLPTLASPSRAPEPSQDYNTLHKAQLIEKKKAEYERIREQRRRFEVEMQKLDQQQRREALELAQMEEEMGRHGGHQSEPTTPPEYRDNSGFPSMFSRPNRYSMSSLTSPPGFFNRQNRSGSQIASPQSGLMQPRYGYDDQVPSRSVPITRRNSDDEKEEAVRQDPSSRRSTNANNRYSMPVTRSRTGFYDAAGLDQTNTTGFLFGDEEPSGLGNGSGHDENFPTLVRHDDQILSASSAALDLALAPSPNPDTAARGWGRVNRHRQQQSLSSLNGGSSQISDRPTSVRASLDLSYISENGTESGAPNMSSPAGHNMAPTPPKLQSSFSANDVPTVKNSTGLSMNANNHAQQHFHNHNASLGRFPAGLHRGHSRDMSNENANVSQAANYPSIQSALQASAPPFGPTTTTMVNPPLALVSVPPGPPVMNSFNNGSMYHSNGYGPPQGALQGVPQAPLQVAPQAAPPATQPNYHVGQLSNSMQQMSMNGANGGNMYQPQNYGGYGSHGYAQGNNQPRDSQARVIQHRRQLDNEAMSRYQNMPLDTFTNQIYDLCKDQHGCRYLQKKLEERNPEQVHAIWDETNQHVVELMTDPFGNYLCQKLLEYCNDNERTVLIQNASRDMVRIALNQHGTRALQKMIEYVSTAQQVQVITEALRFRVVELIQDLNGNHVIQKCLNKLSAVDAQFIFDAVGNNCVEVGTHRHGCCVLQRCIDHASGDQKVWLIQRITDHARTLVKDPFGNYVVQYIIDLNEPLFTEPVVAMFRDCVAELSRHKFSSNVIEKCLRCSQPASKDMIVEELLQPSEMERLLRDNFANYVIQTALEFATPSHKLRLVEAIRPILPQVRTTPYGRRIQAKISAIDNQGTAAASGQLTPADDTQGQIPLRPMNQQHPRAISGGGPMMRNNAVVNGGPNGPGNQLTHQPTHSYSSSMTMSPSSSNGGPVQLPQFGQRTPSSYSPSRSSASGHGSGHGSVNSHGTINGNPVNGGMANGGPVGGINVNGNSIVDNSPGDGVMHWL